MILLYPLVLGAAVLVAARRRESAPRRGLPGLAAWMVAGAVFTFSFLSGLSIGLLILPLAALCVLGAAWWAPHLSEAAGFAVGLGAVLVLVSALGHPGPDWAVAGAIAAAAGVAISALARARSGRSRKAPPGYA